MEMPRQGVALAADREQMQVERQKRLERCVEPANPRDDRVRARRAAVGDRAPRTGSGRTRRTERCRRTPGSRRAARARPSPVRRRSCSSYNNRLLPAPASPTTATTAPRPLAARDHVGVQRRQLGLSADVGRQTRSGSTPRAASQSRSRQARETGSPARLANRARSAGTPPSACTGRRGAASQGSATPRRGRQGRPIARPAPSARRRCRSAAVPPAAVVRRHGPDVQSRLHAHADPWRTIGRHRRRARAVPAPRAPRAGRRRRGRPARRRGRRSLRRWPD